MDCTKSTSDQLFMQLNASELSAIIMKGSPHSNDRDAGFCSGSSEGGDDLLSIIDHSRLEPGSPPTDASVDGSIDLKVTPIALIRNKRKSSEPSKVVMGSNNNVSGITTTSEDTHIVSLSSATSSSSSSSSSSSTTCRTAGPLKKRIRYTSTADSAVVLTPPAIASPPVQHLLSHHHHHSQHSATTPTAVWDPSQVLPHELMPNPAQVFVRHPGVTTLHRDAAIMHQIEDEQEEPLALVLKKPTTAAEPKSEAVPMRRSSTSTKSHTSPKKSASATKKLLLQQQQQQQQQQLGSLDSSTTSTLANSTKAISSESLALSEEPQLAKNASSTSSSANALNGRPQQRNYKNMTRERRIEANARERTRVHTISAAYETLRHAVPSYSSSQKLSKLSVLRVACSYILTLSRMAGHDYSEDQSEPSLADCLEAVTSTIQTEGKVKRKKDE